MGVIGNLGPRLCLGPQRPEAPASLWRSMVSMEDPLRFYEAEPRGSGFPGRAWEPECRHDTAYLSERDGYDTRMVALRYSCA